MCKNTGPQGPEGGSGMRIVVKVGTSTLAHATGRLNIQRMERLCRVLSDLKNAGHEIILVSSGAIGMGVGKLNLPGRPADMPSKQAAAAVGQCELMYTYDKQFTEYSHTVAQLLLTGEDIKSEQRSRNVRNTLSRLLELGALPIINENDAVATDEIGVENTIGENDSLSAIVAAAIGAGIDIAKPDGHMVVDIGGGTSDIAVISLSGVVESASIKVAGDQFNESIVKYMRRKHNVLVGERTAELMKMEIGCVFPKEQETSIEIKGRCLMTGLPKVITVTSTEMLEAFEEPVERILEAVHGVLERTPPELVADISNNGIVMTGGGSLVDGFDKLIEARTGIHTVVAEGAISCVAEGTGRSLDSLNSMTDGTVNLSRRKQMN